MPFLKLSLLNVLFFLGPWSMSRSTKSLRIRAKDESTGSYNRLKTVGVGHSVKPIEFKQRRIRLRRLITSSLYMAAIFVLGRERLIN